MENWNNKEDEGREIQKEREGEKERKKYADVDYCIKFRISYFKYTISLSIKGRESVRDSEINKSILSIIFYFWLSISNMSYH